MSTDEPADDKYSELEQGFVNHFSGTLEPFHAGAGWNGRMDNHQRVWNAIDVMAHRAGLSTSGLARAAGMDATAFNRSKRVDGHGRLHWPSAETIQRILDATDTTWSEFARLVEAGPPASQSDEATTPVL